MELSVDGIRRTPGGPHSKSASRAAVKNEIPDDEESDFSANADDDGGDVGTYKPRLQLPPANVHLRSLGDLMKDLEKGILDLEPEYQRDVVWTADRMTGLINSLMENFYIPPIILNKKNSSLPNGGKSRPTLICVDGKQRLSSVLAFIKGMVPCRDYRGEKWWFCDTLGKPRKKVLPAETQKLFLNKDFVSYLFEDLSPEQEEDLFARVQMGVQLTAAERMRASTGPWQELVRLFIVDFPVIYSLMKDRARGKDFQLTLSCFSQILEVMHPSASSGVPILKTNFSALPKLLGNKGAVDDGIKSHLANVWNRLRDLIEQDPDTFTNGNKYLRGVQTFAPIEMVAVTVLTSIYSDTRNDLLLLGDIQALRVALRERFPDLRLRTDLWKFIWDFIKNLEAYRGAVDGSTVTRRVVQSVRPAPSRPSVAVPHSSAAPTVPTARTKPPSILPPQRTMTFKRKEIASTLPSDPRSPKRKRTESNLENTPAPVGQHSNNIMTSPHIADQHSTLTNSQHPTQACPIPMHTRTATPQFVAQSYISASLTPATGFVSNTATLPQRIQTADQSPLQYSQPTTTEPPRITSPLQRPGLADVRSDQASSSILEKRRKRSLHAQSSLGITPPSTPAQVEQQSVSGLKRYRAPTASMGLSGPFVPIPLAAPASYASVSNPPNMSPPLPSTSRAGLGAGIGAFAPNHTQQQWDGIVRSVSPTIHQTAFRAPVPTHASPLASSIPPPGQPRSVRKPLRSVTFPTPAQYDGAIDLTSDTKLEQERQDLLSSFKGKAAV